MHPIATHAGDEAHGVLGDFLSLLAEFEQGGEAGDVKGGVDDGELEGEFLDELEVGGAEDEDVDLCSGERRGSECVGGWSARALAEGSLRAHLEQVGEIDEHVTRLVHPAGAVETCSDNVLCPSALDEVHVDGEVEVALSRISETVRQT